jgi:hypothetical protein
MRAVPGLGYGREELGQAEDAGVVAVFALDVVDAGPGDFGLFVGGSDPGNGDFDFDAVVEAAKADLAGRGGVLMEIEAELAGGDDGGFELLDVFIGQPGGIGEDAHGATRCGGEAFVVIDREAKVERVLRHG